MLKGLGLRHRVIELPWLERPVLAAVYRRAALVMQPSEREGFGLPVAEAMACGTPVVASQIAALMEVGGTAAEYCNLADVEQWTNKVCELLRERLDNAEAWSRRQEASRRQACYFSWPSFTQHMVSIYQELLGSECRARLRASWPAGHLL